VGEQEIAGETPALRRFRDQTKSCLDKWRKFFLRFICKIGFAFFEDADTKSTGPVSDPFWVLIELSGSAWALLFLTTK
jgi:hypothetical protein